DVADVVETVADVVGREVVGRFEIDADEVADRVVVLVAVEPSDGRPAGIAGEPAIDLDGDRVNPRDHRLALRVRRLWFALRGHLLVGDVLLDLFPEVMRFASTRGVVEPFKGHTARHLLVVVAAHTVFGKDWLDAFDERVLGGNWSPLG